MSFQYFSFTDTSISKSLLLGSARFGFNISFPNENNFSTAALDDAAVL